MQHIYPFSLHHLGMVVSDPSHKAMAAKVVYQTGGFVMGDPDCHGNVFIWKLMISQLFWVFLPISLYSSVLIIISQNLCDNAYKRCTRKLS